MDELNIIDAINLNLLSSIEVPVHSGRLGTYWVQISKEQATDLIVWHDLQHMTVLDVNLYIPVEIDTGNNLMRIGQ